MKIQSINSNIKSSYNINSNKNITIPVFTKSPSKNNYDSFEYSTEKTAPVIEPKNSENKSNSVNVEYYFYNVNGKEVPITDEITTKHTRYGEILYITKDGETDTYDDWAKVKKGNNIKEEVLYSAGLPAFIMEYKDGQPYKRTKFHYCPYVRSYVSFEDGSFDIYQYVGHDSASIKMKKKSGDKITQTNFVSTRLEGDTGSCSVETKDKYLGSKKVSLYWGYPGMDFSKLDTKEDSAMLLDALEDLKSTIHSNEYGDDFGHIKSLNTQLDKAIEYLDKQSN